MILQLIDNWYSFELAKKCMYICFLYWAVGTSIFIGAQVVHPVSIHRKVNFHSPRDLLMFSIVMAWLAMWCFRTMF